ncbi:MAG: DUF1559 domain-containing protein [Planctomycetaceae bacterium]
MQTNRRKCDLRACRAGWRSGFTVVELLVTCAIISLLLALVLPSISGAREAARRTECSNHLRQIGTAAHEHISRTGRFPLASATPARVLSRDEDLFQLAASPHVELMASLDPTLFRQIDCGDRWLIELSYPLKSSSVANTAIQQIHVPVLRCPSDREQAGATNYRGNAGSGPFPYMTFRGTICRDERNGRGAFQYLKRLTPAEFTDGLANTLLFSEKVIGDFEDGEFSPFRDRLSWDVDIPTCSGDDVIAICSRFAPAENRHCSYAGWNWLLGGLNSTLYNHLMTPNSSVPDCSKGDYGFSGGGAGIYTARSLHPGGVNCVMADGATRFVADSIDLDVWRALGTRNGRD